MSPNSGSNHLRIVDISVRVVDMSVRIVDRSMCLSLGFNARAEADDRRRCRGGTRACEISATKKEAEGKLHFSPVTSTIRQQGL